MLVGQPQGVTDFVQRRGVAVIVGEIPAEVHGGLAGAYAQHVTSDVGP